MNRFQIPARAAAPLLLLLVCLLSYGGLIIDPGFFGEDMSLLWLHQKSGFEGLISYYGEAQSPAAFFISGLIRLIGLHPAVYQLLAILARFAGAWAFWLLLGEVWPDKIMKNLLAALVFSVYPGMKSLPVSISLLPHLTAMALTLCGFLMMYRGILAAKNRATYFTISLFCSLSIFINPIFACFEVFRPFLIWAGWRRHSGQMSVWMKTVLTWLPYGILVAVKLIVGPPPPLENTGIALSPNGSVRIFRDLFESVILVWRQIFRVPQERVEILVNGLVMAAAGYVVILLLRNSIFSPEGMETESHNSRDSYLGAGFTLLLVGILSAWLLRNGQDMNFSLDAAGLAILPGAALVVTGLFDLLLLPRFQAWLAALLVSLTVGAQVQNSFSYIREWDRMAGIVQQLQTRLPAIAEGSVLFSEQTPLSYYSEKEMTAVLNLIFFSDRTASTEGLWYLDAFRLSTQDISPEVFINERGFKFNGNLSQSAGFFIPKDGCARLLDAEISDPSNLPLNLGTLLEWSNPDNVLSPDGKVVSIPAFIKSTRVSEGCIIINQIERMNQEEEWQAAGLLLEEKGSSLFEGENLHELIGLVETAAHNNNPERMNELSNQFISDEGGSYELCMILKRVSGDQGVVEEVKKAADGLFTKASCEKYD